MDMNESENRKSTWAICLSIIAILLCLLAFALWAFEVMPHSVITPDTFIGACVALLGVIVTVAVGWQIYNAIEMRQMIRLVEEIQQDLNEKQEVLSHKLEDAEMHSLHLHHLQIAAQREIEQKYVEAVYYYLGALYTNLELPNQPNNSSLIFGRIQFCLSRLPQATIIPAQMYQDIVDIDATIRASKQYHWFASQYLPLFNEFMSKIAKKQ